MKNFKALSKEKMNLIRGGYETDSVGIYNVVDTGSSCSKVYIYKWGDPIPYIGFESNL